MPKKIAITGGLMTLIGVSLIAFQNCADSGVPPELTQAEQSSTGTPAAGEPIPPALVLEIRPSSASLAADAPQAFTAANGVPPYAFSVPSDCGVVNPTTGAYVAPGATTSCTVTLRDNAGGSATASVVVTKAAIPPPKLALVPTNPVEGGTVALSGTGGTPPYAYSISNAGNSSLSGNTITARTTAGPITVQLVDAQSRTDVVTVNVPANPPFGGHQSLCYDCSFAPGNMLTCTCPISVFNGGVRTTTLDYGTCVRSQIVIVAGALRCLATN